MKKHWELPKWRFKILFYLAKIFDLEIRVYPKRKYVPKAQCQKKLDGSIEIIKNLQHSVSID